MNLNIEKYKETLNACRFCPMCKNVCTSGNLSYHESDYPKGRTLIIDSLANGTKKYSPDIVEAVYNCFLCGLCWSNCEGGYKPHELARLTREDIVKKDKAPEDVKKLISKLNNDKNPYGESDKIYHGSEKQAEVLYLMGDNIKFNHHNIADAVVNIFKKVGEDYAILENEPTDGKILYLLGDIDSAKKKAEILAGRINDLNPKYIITSDPLTYDALKVDYPLFGIELKPKVLHISEYLEKLLASKKVTLKEINKKITIADSEFLGRFNNIFEAPRKVLKAIAGENFVEMGFNKEKALATGEAALIFNGGIFNRGRDLGEKICAEAADAGAGIITVLSARAKDNMSICSDIEVLDISELFIKSLG